MIDLRCGDCLAAMGSIPDASVDAVVTDPPAGIAFMGKTWDRHDRSGFIDFLTPRLTEAFRIAKPGSYMLCWALPRTSHWTGWAIEEAGWVIRDRVSHLFGTGFPKSKACLKPAMEDWWLAWKPAKKVTELNIDKCRIPAPEGLTSGGQCTPKVRNTYAQDKWTANWDKPRSQEHPSGRWPTNLTHDGSEEVLEAFAAFGLKKGGSWLIPPTYEQGASNQVYGKGLCSKTPNGTPYGDTGTAARFFFSAKSSKSDRGEGNTHPTVKNTNLMAWLARLITPESGTILDPFMGSGSTGVAAVREGFDFIGIERDSGYFLMASNRIREAIDAHPLFAATATS